VYETSRHVAHRSFSTGRAFDAKAIREMSLAFESVNALGLHVDDEAAKIKVAEKIIELAGHGMRGDTRRRLGSSKRTAALKRGNKNWSPGKRGSTTLSTMELRQPTNRSRSSVRTTTERTSCPSYANGATAYGSMQGLRGGLKRQWLGGAPSASLSTEL
jgi:hypothetical protein